MFGAIAGGIASALAGGAMSKLFGGGQKAATVGIQVDVLATDNNTVRMGYFSSRRRHTRLQGDWSSDVCSSDLALPRMILFAAVTAEEQGLLGSEYLGKH